MGSEKHGMTSDLACIEGIMSEKCGLDMAYSAYTEDTLVQQTTAEYLESVPGGVSVFACDKVLTGRGYDAWRHYE